MASENLNQSSVALTPVEATDYAESVAAYKSAKNAHFYHFCLVLVLGLVLL